MADVGRRPHHRFGHVVLVALCRGRAAAYLLSRIPTLPPWFVELLIKVTADVPGTTSFDGAAVRRLQIRLFQ